MSQLTFTARWVGRLYRFIYSPFISAALRRRGVNVGRNVVFYGKPSIQLAPGSVITIEDGCILCSHAAYTAMGTNRPVTLRTMLPGAKLRLARNVGVSGAVICSAVSIEIEADCLLGSGCTIVDTDFHPTYPLGRRVAPLSAANHRQVRIEQNVFIGAGAFVGKGVTVGRDAVVGAMSVVTKDVPAQTIVAGNPAVHIKATPLGELVRKPEL